jgi:Xaa-Pro aminopeptidase
MLKDRSGQVRPLLEGCGIEALVFMDPANLAYLCGFSGTDGALIVAGATSCFLTDSRYTTQARRQVQAGVVQEYADKTAGILDWLRQAGVRRAGFEAATLPYGAVVRLREGVDDIEWVPLDQQLKPLRGCKDAAELGALERAAAFNRSALDEVLPLLVPGTSERQLAVELEFALKRLGGQDKAFDFIVASGPRGAMPHGVASDKQLVAGELVTIDFGTRVDGYHSDETVTLALGSVAARERKVFDTVLAAHDRAIAGIRPGVALRDIDGLARDYIATQGFGDYFGHGLGHGVGLEVHEYPVVSPRSEAIAEEGMVFTVEPGIYIPDLCGVRIEDMVVVTADGCRLLTRIPKQFRSLPA